MMNKSKIIERMEMDKAAIKEYNKDFRFLKKTLAELSHYDQENGGDCLNMDAIAETINNRLDVLSYKMDELITNIKRYKRKIALIEELENMESEAV